jgi:hypothetical protein
METHHRVGEPRAAERICCRGHRRTLLFPLFFLVVLVAPVAGFAQGGAGRSASDSLRVTGRLLDRATGEDIPAASITFFSVEEAGA